MKTKIKVTVEHYGSFRAGDSHDYKIVKIVGAPTVEVEKASDRNLYETARVDDIINEKQATELSKRVELVTVPKKN